MNFLFWSDGIEAEGDVRVIFKTKIEMERQVPDVFNVFALGEKFTICAENFFLLTIPFPPSNNWLILNALDASCDSQTTILRQGDFNALCQEFLLN